MMFLESCCFCICTSLTLSFLVFIQVDVYQFQEGTECNRTQYLQHCDDSLHNVGCFYGHPLPAFDHLLQERTRNGQRHGVHRLQNSDRDLSPVGLSLLPYPNGEFRGGISVEAVQLALGECPRTQPLIGLDQHGQVHPRRIFSFNGDGFYPH